MKYVLGLMALFIGCAAGVWFPDVDQRIELLEHRSILTHGPLLPIVLFALVSERESIPLRWLAMGVCIGVAVHLAFDLFPAGWTGYALISVLAWGRMSALFSTVWIGVGVAACMYMGAKLGRGCLEAALFVLGVIGVFGNAVLHEDALWRPALVVAVSGCIALALTRKGRREKGSTRKE